MAQPSYKPAGSSEKDSTRERQGGQEAASRPASRSCAMTPSLLKEARGPQRNDSRDGQDRYKMSLEHFVMPESNEIFQKKGVCHKDTGKGFYWPNL